MGLLHFHVYGRDQEQRPEQLMKQQQRLHISVKMWPDKDQRRHLRINKVVKAPKRSSQQSGLDHNFL